jgi:hypothetical protein
MLADGLGCRGINCYVALAVSEVFHLCERPEINLVVIDPSVDDARAKAGRNDSLHYGWMTEQP